MANLLRRRLGGVWPPGMTDSERMADSLSTSSAARRTKTGSSEAAEELKSCRRASGTWNRHCRNQSGGGGGNLYQVTFSLPH